MKVHYVSIPKFVDIKRTSFSGMSTCGGFCVYNDDKDCFTCTIIKKNVTCKNCKRTIVFREKK